MPSVTLSPRSIADGETMTAANNKILTKMLDRLFAGLVSGPSMNCRPHASRQRVDFTHLARLDDVAPKKALRLLLGGEAAVKLTARVPKPRWLEKHATLRASTSEPLDEPIQLTPDERAQRDAWLAQGQLIAKLHIVVDDARTYEQDTGVHVLNVGFPLLSLPPGTAALAGGGARSVTRRLLAPLAFVPVELQISSGVTRTIQITCKSDEVDRVVPNAALLAWLERQTGKPAPELFADESGADPWREIGEIVRHVASALDLPALEIAADDASFELVAAPRADDPEPRPAIVRAAVLGLFPMNNQGLLRDMQAMAAGESLDGPVQSFIDVNVNLDQTPKESYEHEAWSGERRRRTFAAERFVTVSDPCQSRAVRLARECRGLVVHGPPGTGKSQTITNIIGDHLARGERVLMVCDKRTAMDVVANRLDHLGLGSLCALIHDPQRDQRDLYRAVRDQLESLTDVKTDAAAERQLARADAELERLHAELSECWTMLMQKDAQGGCFHERVGQWLALPGDDASAVDGAVLRGASLRELDEHELGLRELFTRAEGVAFHTNAWSTAAAISLADFLARPMDDIRRAARDCVVAAREMDDSADPAVPPFSVANERASPGPRLVEQGAARQRLAGKLAQTLREAIQPLREHWARQPAEAVSRAHRRLAESRPHVDALQRGPLDAELWLTARDALPTMAALARQIGDLEAYLAVASRWFGVFCWRRRGAAARVLAQFGLAPGRDAAARLRDFLTGLRARLVLQSLAKDLAPHSATAVLLRGQPVADDAEIGSALAQLEILLELLRDVHEQPALSGLGDRVVQALVDPSTGASLVEGLDRSAARAAAIEGFESRLVATGLVSPQATGQAVERLAAGQRAADLLTKLEEQLDTLEGVLRVRDGLAALPAWLRAAADSVIRRECVDADVGMAALRKAVLAAEISEQLRTTPKLQSIDGQRLAAVFARYREADQQKRQLVRDTVLHRWTARQQERLLVGTGSRLNSAGADLRRRLTMRGERAMRLRQVISIGQGIEGGDPLFDLRPVWMASPDSVAQIFPRRPVFDVVVFDEASQCRLEEALPVLTRAKRVVIAGDPKQLPPTRFFETALASSEEEDVETEQQLFEAHQGEIEDLLAGALSIDIQQCYLDVHYRSRNSDLIEFSNEQFYSSRLQPIPAHPKNWARFAPITLYQAGGVYDKRMNPAEADQVVKIIADLLRRAEPPSIGVACFNLSQRDLIVERLEERAAGDEEFARRLAEARSRRGSGSFEGLFVKNLENVQGDERDHIIISTTYGPDPKGRFYRRFGPLGSSGGGRRLNVLVTRAREAVHLVTSIPAELYRALPPVPAGQAPSGGWLLFAYLAYAERLANEYETVHAELAEAEKSKTASVHVRPSRSPSEFAAAFARHLATRHNVGSDVHWGNDGFCVDLALHHPHRVEDVTIGVLCDAARFAQAEDPIEWDAFRTAVLEGQGWQLHRVWTPQFFRDSAGCTKRILREAAELASNESARDGLKVVRTSQSP
jgi:hypothetical protein